MLQNILRKPAAKCLLIVILLYTPISLFGCQASLEEQIEEVNKTEDQKILGGIVQDEKRPQEVRDRALAKISDSDILLKIAHSESIYTRKAIKKITDQEILVNILKDQSLPDYIRPYALYNIKDQELLTETVLTFCNKEKENEFYYINRWDRSIAIRGITNQNLLVKIALSDKKLRGETGNDLRLFALREIKDQSLLKHVAQNCHPSIVHLAIERLIRQEDLDNTCPINFHALMDIRHALLEPEIINHYGELSIQCKIQSQKEAEYYNPSDPTDTAALSVQFIVIDIIDNNQKVVSQFVFRGAIPPRKIRLPKKRTLSKMIGLTRQIEYEAKIDVSQICRDLLQPLDESSLRKVMSHNNISLASIAKSMIKE